MKPNSFDDDTARELTGDVRSRAIEAKGRTDAEHGNYQPPIVETSGSYWNQVQSTMEMYVYIGAYKKRIARLQRMENKGEVKL